MAKGLWEKLRTLPADRAEAVSKAIERDDFTGEDYRAAMGEFMTTFLCRVQPWPPKMLESNRNQQDDITVRLTFQGWSPFLYDGLRRKWSSIPLLHRITAPTLMIVGESDTSPEWVYKPFVEHIPDIRYVIISGAGHLYHFETPERQKETLDFIGSFLMEG